MLPCIVQAYWVKIDILVYHLTRDDLPPVLVYWLPHKLYQHKKDYHANHYIYFLI